MDCHICGRKFSGTWNLKRHVMTHSGVRPYKCDGCPKRFTSEKDMEAHRLGHSGQKGFRCAHCPSAFTHLRGLQQHLNIHTEKALTCEKGCGRCSSSNVRKQIYLFCLQEVPGKDPAGEPSGKMLRCWNQNDPGRPHLPMQHLLCSVLGLPTHTRTHRKSWQAVQRRRTGGNFYGKIHPIVCVQVVISIKGMEEEEETTFTEEISTFVISVDDDLNESGINVTDPPMKYMLVE